MHPLLMEPALTDPNHPFSQMVAKIPLGRIMKRSEPSEGVCDERSQSVRFKKVGEKGRNPDGI